MCFLFDSVCYGDDSDISYCLRYDRNVRRISRNRRWSLFFYYYLGIYFFYYFYCYWLYIFFIVFIVIEVFNLYIIFFILYF